MDKLRSEGGVDGQMLVQGSLLGCEDEPKRRAHGVNWTGLSPNIGSWSQIERTNSSGYEHNAQTKWETGRRACWLTNPDSAQLNRAFITFMWASLNGWDDEIQLEVTISSQLAATIGPLIIDVHIKQRLRPEKSNGWNQAHRPRSSR